MAQLRVSTGGAIATITLDTPGQRNAVTAGMWQQFGPILAGLAADAAVKVVVVRGAGGDFSAGADIRDLERILHDRTAGDGGYVTAAENAIASFPKPTIAAIEGYCVGGGWEIAGACDIRIAAESSTFGVTPARIGIIYPLSGIERLVSIAGPAVARYLLFSGELVDATRAYELGLLTAVVTQQKFEDEVAALAATLASRSQLSIHAMKEIIGLIEAGGNGLAAAGARWDRELAASDDAAIGVAAFVAGQRPEFTWTGPIT